MTRPENETMDLHHAIDAPVGDYVNDPPYLEMRLRMLLTGTASPTGRAWAESLKRLLDHLEANPVPDAERALTDERTVPADTPTNADAFADDLADEIRMLDLDDDYIPLVMGSDTPLVERMGGRVLDWTEVLTGGIVDLVRRENGTRDFAVEVILHLEDPKGPPTIALTLLGTDRKGSIEWSSADLSTHDLPAETRDPMIDRIIGSLGGMGTADLRSVADSDLVDLMQPDRPIIMDVRRERVVLTGMEDLHAFVAGASVIVNADGGAVTIPCILHGTIEDGAVHVTAVSLGL